MQQPGRDHLAEPGDNDRESPQEHARTAQPSTKQSYGRCGLRSQPAAVTRQPAAKRCRKIACSP